MCNLLCAARNETHLANRLQANIRNEREQRADRSALINNRRRKFSRFDKNNEKWMNLNSHVLKHENCKII